MNNFLKLRQWLEKKMRQKNKTDFLVLILLGVLVMIIAVPTGNGKKASEDSTRETESRSGETQVQTEEEYCSSREKQLEKLISRMEGAGQTKVMITLADEGETYVDKNTVKDETKCEETTVVYDCGDKEAPYVIRRTRPKVEGVVVVCEGGGSPRVVTQISDAVMSLFGLEAHKVVVLKMSVQEEQQ